MKKILSIDGGGMKGYIPCAFLVELEKRMGKKCADTFDLFTGTSIGGILACLFASETSATDALTFFTTDGPRIFGHYQFLGAGGVVRPRYSADALESCLKRRLGDATLSSLKKALLVPAFDLASYDPYFFKAPLIEEDYPLWQIARATSAAQTYFPAAKLDRMVLWDGGNVVNNPALCALAEAKRLWPDEKVAVLSLSCGEAKPTYPAEKLVNAGLAKVGIETMSVLFEANDELPDYVLKHLLTEGYWRVSPNLTRSLAIDGAGPDDLAELARAAQECISDFSTAMNEFIVFVGLADK